MLFPLCFFATRGLSDEPQLQLIVWNPQDYRESVASPPDRRFNAGLAPYRASQK